MAEVADYLCACAGCGSRSELQMFAHKSDKKLLVGWIFVCPNCITELAGCYINLIVREKKDDET